MDSRLVPIIGTCAAVMVAAAQPAAKTQAPTVTVAVMGTLPGTSLSLEEAGAASDQIAQRLVDSGRYRVLGREWMPAPKDTFHTLPIAELRKAAAAADVEFLVLPSLRQALYYGSRPRGRGLPPTRTPPRITLPLPVGPRLTIGGAWQARPQPRSTQTAGAQLFLDVSIVNVATGQELTSTTIRGVADLSSAADETATWLIRTSAKLTVVTNPPGIS